MEVIKWLRRITEKPSSGRCVCLGTAVSMSNTPYRQQTAVTLSCLVPENGPKCTGNEVRLR